MEIPLTLLNTTAEPGDVRLPATIVVGPRTDNSVHVYAAHDADTDDEAFTVEPGTLPTGFSWDTITADFTIKDDDEPPQTPQTAVAPATNLAVRPGNGSLTVTWIAGSGSTGTILRFREQGASDWDSQAATGPTSTTITGLRNGRTYEVGVASTGSGGTSSGWVSATGTPNVVNLGNTVRLNVQVTPGDRKLTLRWTRTPRHRSNEGPGSYDVQYRTKQRRVLDMITDGTVRRPRYVGNAPVYVCTDRSNDTEGWTSHGSTPANRDTTRVLNGLTPGVEYEVRVRHSSQTVNWFYATGTPSGSGSNACRPTVSVSLSVSPNPVDEGQAVTVTATLSQALPWGVTIPLKLSAHRVVGNRGRPDNGLFIPAGSTSASGRIPTPRDANEVDETFTVAVDAANGSMPGEVTKVSPSITVTITDRNVSDVTRLRSLGIVVIPGGQVQ